MLQITWLDGIIPTGYLNSSYPLSIGHIACKMIFDFGVSHGAKDALRKRKAVYNRHFHIIVKDIFDTQVTVQCWLIGSG